MSSPAPVKNLAHYARSLASLPDNHLHSQLRDKTVAVLGTADAELTDALLATGVARCLVVGRAEPFAAPDRIVFVDADPFDPVASEVDVAFFDARALAGFDHVRDVPRLVETMRRSLGPAGLMFCILKTGAVNHGFDVYNTIVRSRTAFLPSQDYLFGSLLKECTIRMLDWIQGPDALETTRFLRLAIKRPTLLLILGRSQSGKTSLARDFQSLDSQMHVANDYVYCELVERVRIGAGQDIPAGLIKHLGNGGGQACFTFNRTLESDAGLLRLYLDWVLRLLPRDKRIVSMDFDLVEPTQVALAKQILTEAGFSVWVVLR